MNEKFEHRSTYKVLLYTYKAQHGQAPRYISNLIEKYHPTRSLRSATKSLLKEPSCRTTTYGSRSFRVSAPRLWNSLPQHIRQTKTLANFKKLLKTHLFKHAFKLWYWLKWFYTCVLTYLLIVLFYLFLLHIKNSRILHILISIVCIIDCITFADISYLC